MEVEPLELPGLENQNPGEIPKTKLPRKKTVVYGDAILKKGTWHITVQPQAMIRLKRTLSKIHKGSMGTVQLTHTPENAADLLWFTQRYPIRVKPLSALKKAAKGYFTHIERIHPLLNGEITPIDVDLKLPPRNYQRIAIDLGRRNGNLLIADTLGLGKTICGIGMASFSDSQPAVIVVKPNLAIQWQRQFKKFLPELKTHIIKTGKHYEIPSCPAYIISFTKLSKWAEKFVFELKPKLVVFDEIQELRRTESDKYRAALHLAHNTEKIIGLSATPIYNYGDEFFNIMNIIRKGCLGSREEFIREWCNAYGNNYKVADPKALGAHVRDMGIMIRRTLKDVGMEAPKYTKIIEEIPCDPQIIQKAEEDSLELAKIIVSGSFTEQGLASREFNLKMRMATGIAKAPFVAAMVDIMVEQYGKIILTGWHREVYEIWKEKLSKHKPLLYTGSETAKEKDKSITKFIENPEHNILLMSLRSGEGIDGIQNVCSHVVHGEMDWTLKIHQQVTGRVLRPGQKNPVTETFLISKEGSDPFICHINGVKESQSDGILKTNPDREIEMKVDMGRIKTMAIEFLKKKGQYQP